MPTIKPRIATILEPPLYEAVKILAERDQVSLSQKVRDLVMHSLELVEDEELENLVKERKKSKKKFKTLEEVEKQFKIKK